MIPTALPRPSARCTPCIGLAARLASEQLHAFVGMRNAALYFKIWHEIGGRDEPQEQMEKFIGKYKVIRYIPPSMSLEETELTILSAGRAFSFLHSADDVFKGPAILLGNRINLLAIGHSCFRLLAFHPARPNAPGRGILMALARRNERLFGTRVLLYHESHPWFGKLKEEAMKAVVINELENASDKLGIIYAV